MSSTWGPGFGPSTSENKNTKVVNLVRTIVSKRIFDVNVVFEEGLHFGDSYESSKLSKQDKTFIQHIIYFFILYLINMSLKTFISHKYNYLLNLA